MPPRVDLAISKRRGAQKRRNEGNADKINKVRFLKRIANKSVSRMQTYTLKKYKMTPKDFNNIRKCNGLSPLPAPYDFEAPCSVQEAPAEEVPAAEPPAAETLR
jgi:hypothetical protein